MLGLGGSSDKAVVLGVCSQLPYRPSGDIHMLTELSVLVIPADFSNLVSQMHLQDLAEADAVKEQVQQVQVRFHASSPCANAPMQQGGGVSSQYAAAHADSCSMLIPGCC